MGFTRAFLDTCITNSTCQEDPHSQSYQSFYLAKKKSIAKPQISSHIILFSSLHYIRFTRSTDAKSSVAGIRSCYCAFYRKKDLMYIIRYNSNVTKLYCARKTFIQTLLLAYFRVANKSRIDIFVTKSWL